MLMYLIFLCLSNTIESARILAVFPLPSISHHIALRPFTEELIKSGHKVVVITAYPAYPAGQSPANLTEIDVHDAAYSLRSDILKTANGENVYDQVESIFNLLLRIFEKVLKTEQIHKFLRDDNKFDLLILEACARSTLAFSHVYKAPVIAISSFGTMDFNNYMIGSTTHPLLYPTIFHKRLYNLTLWEKVSEIYNYYSMRMIDNAYEERENKMLREYFGSDMPTLKELNDNVDMLFLNVHPIWEHNRPMPPNVLFLGGLHLKPVEVLPKDLKSYLDTSVNGVIYISFGTNVDPSMLPPETVQTFVQVFSQLPYDVLWKWDKDELPYRSKNIRIAKWLPQSDLLRHPKIKLFITQGGLQSTDEAILAEVPMIGIPMLGDQWANVEKYVHLKIGLRLDIATISEHKLMTAITTMIKDESYRRNVAKLRSVMYDQPQRPIERAMWWAEYLLRHGGARHLRAPSANMSWAKYLEMDLVLVLLTTVITCIIIIIGTLYSLVNIFWRYPKKIRDNVHSD